MEYSSNSQFKWRRFNTGLSPALTRQGLPYHPPLIMQGFPENLLGSALIGVVFNTWCVSSGTVILWFFSIHPLYNRIVGLICVQSYNYYVNFPNDRLVLKFLVIICGPLILIITDFRLGSLDIVCVFRFLAGRIMTSHTGTT